MRGAAAGTGDLPTQISAFRQCTATAYGQLRLTHVLPVSGPHPRIDCREIIRQVGRPTIGDSAERWLVKAAEFAAVQGPKLATENVQSGQPYLQVLANGALIEGARRPRQFDFTMQRLVRHA
jgi:hypothetical protein